MQTVNSVTVLSTGSMGGQKQAESGSNVFEGY